MSPGGSRDGAGCSAPAPSAPAAPAGDDGSPESKGGTNGGGTAGSSPAAGAGSSTAMKKGPWTAAEDAILIGYVREHGEGNWNAVQKNTGLSRCGKSCRLRWANHLRPNLKKGSFSPEEERLILELHAKMGNKWARMAAQMPGRTDNEIKNYWNTRIKRRQRAGLPLYPADIQRQAALHHRPQASGPAPPMSLFDHKPQLCNPVGAAPLPLFDPTGFAGTPTAATLAVANPLFLGHPQPFFGSPHQRRKRVREDDMSFSLPFSTNPVPPSSSQTNTLLQFNPLGNYDLGHLPHPPMPQQQSFSVQMELPSNQFFPEPPAAAAGGGGVLGLPYERGNSELLDALLRDTRPEGSSDNGGQRLPRDFLSPEAFPEGVKWVKAPTADAHPSGNLPIDANIKTEPAPVISSVEDLSALLDVIPMTAIPAAAPGVAPPLEWHTGDSGEVSNGQSSAVTDEIGLQMQELASSLSVAAEGDQNWSVGPCQWGGAPGIR